MEYNNRGSLGKNKKPIEERNVNAPEYQGKCIVDNVEYYVSAWIRTNTNDNSKFFSLAFTPKDEKPQQSKSSIRDIKDDIPF